jgi:putative membrane protein
MRRDNFVGFISASLVVMLLTLVPGWVCAADNPSLSPEEQSFLTQAISDNAGQIAMAKLALQKSQNQKVIDLANAVIHERMALDEDLVRMLHGAVGAVRPAANNEATMASLQALNGEAFDKTFAGLLVRDHNKIISAYECVKASSTNLALRNIVHKAVPDLRGNLMVAIAVLRSSEWAPAAHQQALTTADTHNGKTSVFQGEPLTSIVTAPW